MNKKMLKLVKWMLENKVNFNVMHQSNYIQFDIVTKDDNFVSLYNQDFLNSYNDLVEYIQERL